MTTLHHRKRSAAEPVDTLLGHEAAAAASAKRPAALTLGAAFVFARALAGLLWIASFSVLWPDLVRLADVETDEAALVYWLIVGVGALGVVALAVLGWAILRGSNFARVLVMFGLMLSTIAAAVGYFVNGEEITIRTTLLTLALDILVLLALSSRDARNWSRKPRT
ncbi:MAG: hypothetical protein GX862_06020 [Leucobacter sp.]|nr:hypothetical protein [Leucobacter sp.]